MAVFFQENKPKSPYFDVTKQKVSIYSPFIVNEFEFVCYCCEHVRDALFIEPRISG